MKGAIARRRKAPGGAAAEVDRAGIVDGLVGGAGAAAVEGMVHELLGWAMFLVAFVLMAACARAVGGHAVRPQSASS